MTSPMGPYQTEADALAEPLSREVQGVRDQVSSVHDSVRIGGDMVRLHLAAACSDAGVELGAFDRQILGWLSGWETSTAQVVIGLISRAYAAGQAAAHTPAPSGIKPVLRVEHRGHRLTRGQMETSDGDFYGISLPHADWAALESALGQRDQVAGGVERPQDATEDFKTD